VRDCKAFSAADENRATCPAPTRVDLTGHRQSGASGTPTPRPPAPDRASKVLGDKVIQPGPARRVISPACRPVSATDMRQHPGVGDRRMALTLIVAVGPFGGKTRVSRQPGLGGAVVVIRSEPRGDRRPEQVVRTSLGAARQYFQASAVRGTRRGKSTSTNGSSRFGGDVLEGAFSSPMPAIGDHDVDAPHACSAVSILACPPSGMSHCGYRRSPHRRVGGFSSPQCAASCRPTDPVTEPPVSLTTTRAPRDAQADNAYAYPSRRRRRDQGERSSHRIS